MLLHCYVEVVGIEDRACFLGIPPPGSEKRHEGPQGLSKRFPAKILQSLPQAGYGEQIAVPGRSS